MKNNLVIVRIEKYNQKGEGVGFINDKPVYVFGSIIGEEIIIKIIKKEPTYYVGLTKEILIKSPNRIEHNIDNAIEIGGYELIHMNDKEQKKFKLNRVINDFKQIAKIQLNSDNISYFEGKNKIKYRNKITLHDGCFYKKNTNILIKIENYLLSDIPYDKNLKGKIIYRKLDTLIFGNKDKNKYTTDTMLNYKFKVSLNSFYQINKEVATKVYEDVLENVIENGITLDLFAGIGTITIITSQKSKQVYGVEINKSSFEDALFNIENNKINNIYFFKDDVNKFINKFDTSIKIDTLIVDPSRKGVSKSTIDLIIKKIKPKRIIYLSCNPATQAANFFYLKNKYKINKIKIYDMFPQTYHIESLIILDLIK